MKTHRFLIAAFAAIVAASSCDHKIDIPTPIEEGLPASVSISISSPAPVEVVSTKATDVQETNVSKLALIFYSQSNTSKPAAVIEINKSDLTKKKEVTSTNYIYTIDFEDEALVSGSYYLYAVANYNASTFGSVSIDDLRNLSLSGLQQFVVSRNNTSLDMTEDALLLSGIYGRDDGAITLQPGENDFTESDDATRIHLRRITAKVTLSFTNGAGVTFTPKSYTIYNYPLSSTLIERKGWQLKDGSSDNINGTFPGALTHNGSFANPVEKNYDKNSGIMFYMHENVQATVAGLIYNDRDKHKSFTDQGFLNAPEGATYIVVKGDYSGPKSSSDATKVTGDVSYTIHLGNFGESTGSYGNFTVRRNAKYNYKVTVNGVSSIITEAMASVDDPYTEDNSGAEGHIVAEGETTNNITVDAHYETVMLKIKASDVKGGAYKVLSSTPYDNNVVYDSSDPSSKKPADAEWIKFAKPQSATQLAIYPGSTSDKLCNIYKLIEDLQSTSATKTYAVESNGYYYITAFVNEYFYDKKPGTENKAHYSEFVNKDNRELKWMSTISISPDKQSSYSGDAIFSIKQKSIKTMFKTTVDNPFGLESVEEFDKTQFSASGNTEYGIGTTSRDNGWSNTAAYFALGTTKWSKYINYDIMGHFDNGAVSTSAMTGNYATTQCLSRNRDENGDGKIDREEIKWYLPALGQIENIWSGWPVLSDETKFNLDNQTYFTSTGGTNYASMRIWWADEGASYGSVGSESAVRCIRSLGTYNEATTDAYVYDSDNRIVNVSNISDGATKPAGSSTVEWLANHYRNDEPDILPSSFQIASRDLTTESDGTIYTIASPKVKTAVIDGNNLAITFSNASEISRYYSLTAGGSTVEPDDNGTVTLSATDGTISLVGTRTISGTAYKSNSSTVTVKKTKTGETTTTTTLEAPTLSYTSASYNGSTLTVNFKITNYDSSMSYSTSDGTLTDNDGNAKKITKQSNSFTQDKLTKTFSITGTKDGNTTNESKITVTVTRKSSGSGWWKSYTYSCDGTVSNGNSKSITTTEPIYEYAVTGTANGADYTVTIGAISASEAKKNFTLSEFTSGSYCQDYYYEKEDKSDLGLWRIPNEREFALVIKFASSEMSGDGTNNARYAARTSYLRRFDTKATTGFIYSKALNNINTNAGQSASANIHIRCVRDVTPTK